MTLDHERLKAGSCHFQSAQSPYLNPASSFLMIGTIYLDAQVKGCGQMVGNGGAFTRMRAACPTLPASACRRCASSTCAPAFLRTARARCRATARTTAHHRAHALPVPLRAHHAHTTTLPFHHTFACLPRTPRRRYACLPARACLHTLVWFVTVHG